MANSYSASVSDGETARFDVGGDGFIFCGLSDSSDGYVVVRFNFNGVYVISGVLQNILITIDDRQLVITNNQGLDLVFYILCTLVERVS